MSYFISFEGVDGAGKGTQLEMLYGYLKQLGIEFEATREPGGTLLAEKIRNLVLDNGNAGMTPITEMLLFQAARNEHVEHRIKPALRKGRLVICDRFADSSYVYQGVAGGLGVELVVSLNKIATGGLEPHLTIVLDLPWEVARQRQQARGEADRMEAKADSFHDQVRGGYHQMAAENPRRVKLVDASGTPEQVFQQVRRHIDVLLKVAKAG